MNGQIVGIAQRCRLEIREQVYDGTKGRTKVRTKEAEKLQVHS
jgi:hypothetical protein